ncbi:hypothetical protein VCHA53O466_140149 [Vibrio chagasii]|nr:hypothetical protein VCHA53O466_140149 [Vibrio chagasii]
MRNHYSEFKSAKDLTDYFHLIGEAVNGEAHFMKVPTIPVYLRLDVGDSDTLHIHIADSIYNTTHANLDVIDNVTQITNRLVKLEQEVSEYGTPIDITFLKLTNGEYRVAIELELSGEDDVTKSIQIDGSTPDGALNKLANWSRLL